RSNRAVRRAGARPPQLRARARADGPRLLRRARPFRDHGRLDHGASRCRRPVRLAPRRSVAGGLHHSRFSLLLCPRRRSSMTQTRSHEAKPLARYAHRHYAILFYSLLATLAAGPLLDAFGLDTRLLEILLGVNLLAA